MQTFLQIAFERVALLNKCLSKILQGVPTSFFRMEVKKIRILIFFFFFVQKNRNFMHFEIP